MSELDAGSASEAAERAMESSHRVQLVGIAQRHGLTLGFLALCVVLSIVSPVFLTAANIFDIILQSSVNAAIALGMTFVIATGGIDLSVGSIWALSGIATGLVITKAKMPWPVGIVSGLLVAALCGELNGFLITKGNVPPFIASLGTMSVFRGLALIISGGYTVYGFPRAFQVIGSGKVWIIPIPVLILAVLFLCARFLLTKCTFGRYLVAIGGNKSAARLCGIDVQKNVRRAYVMCAIMTAIGAMIATGRLDAAEPIAGSGAELDAIAAVVMGGTSLSGGNANVAGTLLGALVIGTVRNGLTLMNVPTFYQMAAIGVIIIAAVLLDRAGKEE